MADRVQFIEHRGKRVLLLDFSHCGRDEMMNVLSDAQATIAEEPHNSVLVMADFTDATVDKAVATRIKEALVLDRPYVRRSYWVGTEHLPKVYYENFKIFSQRDFPTFKTREEALDWLVTE